MTSSVTSDRTPRPSSPPRHRAFSSPNLLKRFFLMCSGATREILYTPSCVTEWNKYAMLGAIIFFTAGVATLSGGYAAYTAFRETAVATALGVLWGLFIFTLDRLIVSGIRKQKHEPSDTWSVLFGKSLRGIIQAFPRIVLAVFLAIVIATPLELKLFEREIQLYMAQDTQMRAIEPTFRTTLHVIDIIGDSIYLLCVNLCDLTRQTARVPSCDRTHARRFCACAAGLCCGLCRTLSARQDLGRQGAPPPE